MLLAIREMQLVSWSIRNRARIVPGGGVKWAKAFCFG
jgi:hypothetical protein